MMNKNSLIPLGISILILSISLEAQAQGYRIRTSSYPGIHGSIIVPQSENRGYNNQERDYYGQGNHYYSRERIVIERTSQGSCDHCFYPSRSYPYQYNRGNREYYHPNRFNDKNYYAP